MNYNKLINLNPTVYCAFTNSKGQFIELVEHPLKGDEHPVIVLCRSLQIAETSEFWEIDDMIAEHGEYEPYFFNGELRYGL